METKTPPVTEVTRELIDSTEPADTKTVQLSLVDTELAQRLYQVEMYDETERAVQPLEEVVEPIADEPIDYTQDQTVTKVELAQAADRVPSVGNVMTRELSKSNTEVAELPSRELQTDIVGETIGANTDTDKPSRHELAPAAMFTNEQESPVPSREVSAAAHLQAWEAVLYEEPRELYHDFAQTLEAFIIAGTHVESDGMDDELLPIPPIAIIVSERLIQLSTEEQAEVARTMQDVIGALHGLQVLEACSANLEVITAVERQLEELCVALFEQLEIDYTEQDIKDFVAILRDPEFRPERSIKFGLDASDLGTHESKYFARMVGMATDAESQLHTILGTMVLASLGLRTMARGAAWG